MFHFFVKVYRFFLHRQFFLWSLLIILILFFAYIASQLKFEEDISAFFPDKDSDKRINYAYQHIGASNNLIINIKQVNANDSVEQVNYELLQNCADRLSQLLLQQDSLHLIKNIKYDINQNQINELTQFIIQNLPYFLTEEDYDRIDSLLLTQNIDSQLINNKFLLSSPIGFLTSIIANDPLFFSTPVLQKLSLFQVNDQFTNHDGYLFNREENEAVIVVTSNYPVSETDHNAILIGNIEKAIKGVENENSNKIEALCFGASMVSLTNSQQIKKDSILAIVLSMVFILALIIYFYRDFKNLIYIVLSVFFGFLFALGTIVFFTDTISIIAVGMASIIIGIAVNYPLHFLAHNLHVKDKEQIIRDIVNPLLIGNITTVGAFLSLLFISSSAMKDFGLFTSLLMVGTILFVLIFLPHFPQNNKRSSQKISSLAFDKLANFTPENNKWIVIGVILLTIILAFFSTKTSFDTKLQHINYMTDDQRQLFQKLVADGDTTNSTLYFVSEGKNIDEALRYYEKGTEIVEDFQLDSSVVKCSHISVFLPSMATQQERIDRWNNYWAAKRETFCANFDQEAVKNGFLIEGFQPFKDLLYREFTPQPIAYFEPVVRQLANNFILIDTNKSLVYSILQVDNSEVEKVETTLNGVDHHLYAFSNLDFTTRMVNALSNDFNYVLFICAFIVFVFLFISFGRFEICIISFIPLSLAWIWILGLMGIFDIRFNIVNIILATFIFGQGDDYTIFVTEGLMYEYRTGKKILVNYKNTVILSALIMFIGIGMLIFAKHPAMKSLAEVTIVGMFSVLIMAYIFPPLIFKWLVYKNGKTRINPITFWNYTKTVIMFVIFLVGAVILTLIGFFLLTIGGKSEKHRDIYHKVLYNTMRFLVKLIIQVKYKVENPYQETFEKPSVIICNHQSHFDLLYTLMLSPKIIVLTNQKSWKSPFYGFIIRYAEFLPVTYGIEENIPKLAQLVERGYSILIFPEGTRSLDHSILRFHKGAFYLADKLQLDILPVVTHGIGHFLSKAQLLCQKSTITISILERITAQNPDYRLNKQVNETTKLVRQLYIKEYQLLVKCNETPDYFNELVIQNYIYKGAQVERNCKKLLAKHHNFNTFIEELPEAGSVAITHCGQGEFPLMAALVKKNLHIIATELDDDLFDIAAHCASIPENLHYVRIVDNLADFDLVINFQQHIKRYE